MSIRESIRYVLIWTVAKSGAVRLYQRRLQRRGPLVRVLCLHDVPDRQWFAHLVSLLVTEYQLITPQEFHAQQFDTERINVLLTFDDGYQSWVDVALPVLAEHNAKGLFFVTSGLLDAATESKEVAAQFMRNRLCLTQKRSPLTWTGAEALVAAGHTVGGHTVSHTSLATLPQEEAAREITEDKKRLEQMLSVTLEDFAYPFGRTQDYHAETVRLAAAAGYTHQYAATTGFVTAHKKAVSLPRTLLEVGQSPAAIKRWVEGGYDIVQQIKLIHGA